MDPFLAEKFVNFLSALTFPSALAFKPGKDILELGLNILFGYVVNISSSGYVLALGDFGVVHLLVHHMIEY